MNYLASQSWIFERVAYILVNFLTNATDQPASRISVSNKLRFDATTWSKHSKLYLIQKYNWRATNIGTDFSGAYGSDLEHCHYQLYMVN